MTGYDPSGECSMNFLSVVLLGRVRPSLISLAIGRYEVLLLAMCMCVDLSRTGEKKYGDTLHQWKNCVLIIEDYR